MISHIIWDISPEVFPKFELLRWYGLSWVLGVVLGYAIIQKIYKSEGLPIGELDLLTVWVMLGGIIGARLGHIIFYDPIYYLENPIEVLPFKLNPFQFTGFLGLASHGGIAGALLALYLYCRKFKKDYLWMLDRLMIPGVALGGAIRLGNLVNSEIIGTPTDVPWAFVFTRIDDIPRHPAQLYEAIFYFTLSIALYFLWKRIYTAEGRGQAAEKRREFSASLLVPALRPSAVFKNLRNKTGFIFGLGIALIFIQRFLIEFLKEDQVAFEAGLTLNMGQMLSVPLVVVGVVIMIRSLRNSRTDSYSTQP